MKSILFCLVFVASLGCATALPPGVSEAVCYNGQSDCLLEASHHCSSGANILTTDARIEGRAGDNRGDIRIVLQYVCK